MEATPTVEQLFLQYHGSIVPRSFNAGFVTLSYVVSLIGAGSTLELINRRTAPKGFFNHLLLVSSAVTMGGISIWCMHFIGNRAITLAQGERDLQIAYSGGFTALSFFMPIFVLLPAFVLIGTNNTVSWWRVVIGGILAGAAICGMHYLGDASIDNYACEYNPINVVGAAIISCAASVVALAMFFVFRAAWANAWWKRLASAVVLAGAVSGMHWCAATGTQYRLVKIESDSNELSRNTTVIVVICLSVGACFVMAGIAIYNARVVKRYARKAQQVVLAAAVFDKQGRVLVSPDGLVPCEKITDTFLEKSPDEAFSTAHPLFHWMFQASRNWSGISTLIGGMTNHLAHLPRHSRERDARLGIKLVSEHGEMLENYDLVFRELFCVAAVSLADKMKEHLGSAGILWDEILPTGAGGERHGHGLRRRRRGASQDGNSESKIGLGDPEKGGHRHKVEYGRGSLMFLVRQVQSERDVERLEAAGYRFAEPRQVAGIIGSSMQVRTHNFEAKLRDMAKYAEDGHELTSGVHIGFFGIRARVGSYGFDVLVRKGARHLLPSMQMPIERLEAWQADFIRQLDKTTVARIFRKLDHTKDLTQRETLFASKILGTLDALRTWIGDPVFDEAMLSAKVISLPSEAKSDGAPPASNSLIAFRLVIPIHVHVKSPHCEFIPLSFFKVHQLSGKSSPHNLEFTRSVHRELAPVINAVPIEKSKFAIAQDCHSPTAGSSFSAKLRRFGRTSFIHPVDADGRPIPTVFGRPSSASLSNKSDSTLKLWSGRSSGPQSPSRDSYDGRLDDQHEVRPQVASFSGIMVSQEITVDVVDVAAGSGLNSPTKSVSRDPSIMAQPLRQTAPETLAVPGTDDTTLAPRHGRGKGSVSTIEMTPLPQTKANIHTGVTTQVSNVEAEKVSARATYVDELFETCIDAR